MLRPNATQRNITSHLKPSVLGANSRKRPLLTLAWKCGRDVQDVVGGGKSISGVWNEMYD
ncbi:hypothetical protein E2C01_097228 [Portunus trituberculatus]|uniref:Uncharacterized protein n=1 Tax=Portunus trituberculatus TaxID=210409 RepID=A0A5B7K3Y9_PORTR|nr:hypothetical protein [Portunus trituberculatus]